MLFLYGQDADEFTEDTDLRHLLHMVNIVHWVPKNHFGKAY